MRRERYSGGELQKTARVFLFAGLLLAGLVARPTDSDALETLTKTFEFGPGTTQHHSHFRTLTVPLDVIPSVTVQLQRDPGGNDVPVVIEVHAPSIDTIGATGPDGPLLGTLNATARTTPQALRVSFGFNRPIPFCPFSWRVRVRTANSLAPPVKVFGSIVFSFGPPFSGGVKLESKVASLEPGKTATRDLAPIFCEGGTGCLDLSNVFGELPEGQNLLTGTFRIKGAWHTDFEEIGGRAPVTASLLRPDGTVAASQTGFSQLFPGDRTPRLNFTFDVFTIEDVAALPSIREWGLRIKNGDPLLRLTNFDTVSSTFTAGCFTVGSFQLTPTDTTVAVHERLNYSFTWTVPAPLNWHDLESLQLRIRDGEGVALWLKFDEASNRFSLISEATGKPRNEGFGPGSPNRLRTSQATVHLAETSVVGSGPTGPSVTLNLSLSFKPRTAGHTFRVEVAGSDDRGNQDDVFAEAGTLVVGLMPPHAHHDGDHDEDDSDDNND